MNSGTRNQWRIGTTLLVLLAFAVAGCSAADESAPASVSRALHVLDRPADLSVPGPKRKYTLAASIYAGWMPWYYAAESGVLGRCAEEQGIEIEFLPLDYISSIETLVTGRADACLMTNIDALGLPAAAGIDVTALVVGDYSNGNDKVLARGIRSLEGLRGQEVALVELSVSDYLLSRALESAGMSEGDVRLLNTGDSKIGAEFLANKQRRAVVTWNPIAMELERERDVHVLFDSAQIPGEILDLCVVRTATLAADPRLGRALVAAWFEVLDVMRIDDEAEKAAIARMAELAGCSVAEFQLQLATTHMFWTPSEAVAFAESAELRKNMERVRRFCFVKGLFGDGARRADVVGIAYPDGAVQGSPRNVRMRFDTSFAERME